MGWNDVQEPKGRFVKWSEAPMQLVFLDEPIEEKKHFIGQGQSPIECDGENCRRCANGDASRVSYRFNVRDRDGHEREFTLSAKAAVQLKKVRDRLGDRFSRTWIDCENRGDTMRPDYKFRALDEMLSSNPDEALPF